MQSTANDEIPDDIHRRLGTFSIEHDIVKEHVGVFALVMGSVLVTRAESMFSSGVIEYCGMCPQFDVVAEGEVIPAYEIEVQEDEDENQVVVFKKKD